MPKDNRQDDSTKIFLEISVNLASTEVFLPFELVEQVVLRSDGKKTRYLVPSGRLVFKPTLDLGASGHSKKSRKVPGKIECLMENGKWFIVNQTYSHLYARVSENSVLLFSNLKFLTVKESKIGEAASQSYISSQGMTHPYLTSAPNIICIPPGHTGCPHLTPAGGGRELFEDAIRVNEDYLASYARTPKNHSDNVAAHKASIVAAARGNLAQTVVVNLSGMDSFLVLQAMIEAKIASKSTCKIIAHHVDISEWGERSFWARGSGTWQRELVRAMVQELQTNSFEYIETRPSAKFRYSNLLLSRAKFLGVSERLTPENAEEFHASFYEFYESLSTPAVVLNGDRVTALYQAFNGTGELALFGHAAELFGLYRRIKFGRFGIAVTYFIFSIVFPQLAKEELLARTAGAHILAESMGTYTTKRLNWRAWKYEKNSEALRLYRFLATQWVGSTEETNSAGFITFTRDVTIYEQISRENQGCLPEGFTFSLLGSLDSTPMISVSSQGFMQTIIPKLVARVLIAEFGVHLMKALRKTAPPRGLRWRQGLRMVDEVLGFISPLRRTHQLWKRVRRS